MLQWPPLHAACLLSVLYPLNVVVVVAIVFALVENNKKCEDGDIIDMILNFENLSLRYKINDVDCCWYVNRNVNAFDDIVKGRYKAVVSIYDDGGACTIQLMSYQHIV